MPLKTPEPRKPIHHRRIDCNGYRREDGLIDIDGRLVDTKAFDFPNKDRGGIIRAGEALHDIRLRITIDLEMNIVDADASLDATPYNYCPRIAPVAQKLIGLRIAPGFRQQVKQRIGGVQGCTHLTELLGPIATTAVQTLVSERARQQEQDGESAIDERKLAMGFLDSCHSLASSSPVVREHWPKFYKPGGDDKEA
jgi:hypothetical protein